MSQSLREKIEGLTGVCGMVERREVIRILAEHEREQAAVAIGVQPILPCAPEDDIDWDAKLDLKPPQITELAARGYKRVNRNANDIGCRAGTDGDCYWSECPQINDGEPKQSGRSCPLWYTSDREA